MKARRLKELKELKPGEIRRIERAYEDHYRNEYKKALERDGRIMLDLYTKMNVVILHDKLGMDEDELMLYLGHHRETFFDQRKMVQSGEQIDYLNRRMEEIFKKNGFPQHFFDKMLGSVESPKDERNGANVLNESPADYQTESVTEQRREDVESPNDERNVGAEVVQSAPSPSQQAVPPLPEGEACCKGEGEDVVSVIRCRDCKHGQQVGELGVLCEYGLEEFRPFDHFCAWAERRTYDNEDNEEEC